MLSDYSPFDLLPDAVLVVDRVGVIHYANGQAAVLFGAPAASFVGALVESLLPAYLRSKHAQHRKTYAAAPHMRPMGAGLTLMAQRSDGSNFPVDIMLNPIKGAAGPMVLAVVRDVSERREAEVALQRSQKMLELLLEHAPDAVLVVDEHGRIERVNAMCEALFGRERTDMVGDSIESLIPESMRERHERHRASYSRDLRRRSMGAGLDLFARRGDGSQFPVDIMLSPLEVDGRHLVLAAVRDITERRQHEERAQLLMKEVNHRAKNMLGVIQAIARQTAAPAANATTERFTGRIAALAAIQDLLIGENWSGVDLRALLDSQLAPAGDFADARITRQGPPLRISANAAQPLGMALHELIDNALRHGALRAERAGDTVEVAWWVSGDATAAENFHLVWRETGEVPQPRAAGYGTSVLIVMIKLAFAGSALLEFGKQGVEWRLVCPAGRILQGAS